MTKRMRCPKCGADIFMLDDYCMECGVDLVGGKLARDRNQPIQRNMAPAVAPPPAPPPPPPPKPKGPYIGLSCPYRDCAGEVAVPNSEGARGRAYCQSCGRPFAFLLGTVRSQGGRIIERGGDLKEWQMRVYEHPKGRSESILRFVGMRDIEAKSTDRFVFIEAEDGSPHNVFMNMTLNAQWAMRAAPQTGCLLPCLLWAAMSIIVVVALGAQ